jgi:hypothetical protein
MDKIENLIFKDVLEKVASLQEVVCGKNAGLVIEKQNSTSCSSYIFEAAGKHGIIPERQSHSSYT